jgi:monofunctional biosynthetic peptidoglycan transglycosylase
MTEALSRPGVSGGRWLRRAVLAIVAVLAFPYVLAVAYVAVPPPSTLMLTGWVTGAPVDRRWVPIERISPHLIVAVMASEDARFCHHWGVDPGAVRDALRQAEQTGAFRGASTISMQTAKNLFLWHDRSYVRKVLELPLAAWIDLIWSKERLLEIYLNVAEWGPGVYGAEAAAQTHFGVPANRITPAQALLLATALPNPAQRTASEPTQMHRRLAERLRVRVARGGIDTTCLPRLAAR